MVARGDLEVVVAQLDAESARHIALALQIPGHAQAQVGKDAREFRPVAHGVQVAVERRFAAHAHGLALGHHRAVVAAPGHAVHPGAGGLAEVADEPLLILRGQLTDGFNAQPRELLARLGANAVDLAHVERPNLGLQVFLVDDGNAIGLVELAGHLGQQPVGRHADGTGEPRLFKDAFLDEPRQHAPTLALAARHVGKVDVHLVHATVLHHGRNLQNGSLEGARVAAHLVKVHRQHDGLGAQLGRLHHAHGRAHAELPRGVGGRGDHAPAHVVLQTREVFHRDEAPLPLARAVRPLQQQFIHLAAPAANHHRQTLELRVAQQLHGGEEGVHVQVGDAAQAAFLRGWRGGGFGGFFEWRDGHARYCARRCDRLLPCAARPCLPKGLPLAQECVAVDAGA